MKIQLLSAVVLLGLISCGEGKNVEDIEKEFKVENTDHGNNTSTNSEQTTEDLGKVINYEAGTFEFFEDYGALTTKTALYGMFGKENLVDGISYYAEGTVEFQHTILTDPVNGNVYKYVWNESDNETLNFIETNLFIWDENYEITDVQLIQSRSGVYTGMTLKELYEWNNSQDFTFYGFGWDYEGNIAVEKGSVMASSGVDIKLALENYSGENINSLLGDVELSTKDKGIFDAPIVVDQLSYYGTIEL